MKMRVALKILAREWYPWLYRTRPTYTTAQVWRAFRRWERHPGWRNPSTRKVGP